MSAMESAEECGRAASAFQGLARLADYGSGEVDRRRLGLCANGCVSGSDPEHLVFSNFSVLQQRTDLFRGTGELKPLVAPLAPVPNVRFKRPRATASMWKPARGERCACIIRAEASKATRFHDRCVRPATSRARTRRRGG
jgi:hypothetical protein